MTVATDAMRRAYLHAALDTHSNVTKDGFVSRGYIREKVDIAFKAEYEADLVGKLDLQRQALYYSYLRERWR